MLNVKPRFAVGDVVKTKRPRRVSAGGGKSITLLPGARFTITECEVDEITHKVFYVIRPDIFGSIRVRESEIDGTV